MSDQDHDELIQQFSTVSGVDADRAKFFLEAAAWKLSTALSSFYEDGGSDVPLTEEQTLATAQQKASSFGGIPKLPTEGESSKMDDDEDETFSSDEEEGQAFYAGGSTHSGQQVIGPSKKKDVVSRLFKAAKEHGAEVVTESKDGKKTKKAAFRGTSYRLGETSDDTLVYHDPNAPSQQAAVPVELRMWSNGFSVDDGPLRSYNDPESMKFLSDIKNGRIPIELLRNTKGKEIAINMSDRHHEEYAAPKPEHKAFSGSGQTLGSPAPSVVGQVSHVPGPGGSAVKPPTLSAADPKAQEEMAKKQLALDDSQPATNIQVRLGDGSRLIIRVNHTHTVGDLRTYVTVARPMYSTQEFALMTTFPHAELSDSSATVKAANILNSAIVVKNK